MNQLIMPCWKLKYSSVPGTQIKSKFCSLFIIFAGFTFVYITAAFFFETFPITAQVTVWKNTEPLRNQFDFKKKLYFDFANFTFFGEDEGDKGVNSAHRIAIVMVLSNDTKPENYDIAIQTARCYCKIHNYEFVLAVDSDFNCSHKDKFFRRHCAAARILPLFDAILFLDADIGVVNPKVKIETFLVEGIDIIFYDRFYNWEIMAGSYIARNTNYAKDLLNEFADYEFQLPASFHGTDNGALHIFLAEKLFPQASIEIGICKKIYNASKDFDDLFTYEACTRALFGVGTDFGKVRIMKKGTGWARDGWLTSMLWHPELDFMFHGWKMNQLRETPRDKLSPNQMGRSHWYNPLNGPIDLNKCNPQNATWSYDQRLQGNKDEIRESLRRFEEEVVRNQINSYSRIPQFL